jgi:predicted porin
MNRKLLAAAVAGAIGVPTTAMAELTINGLLSPSINYVSTFDRGDADSDRVSLEDNQSDIGFKWDEDLGAGTKFIGYIDLSIPIGDPGITGNGGSGVTTRDVYAGFDGGWGRVIFGDASTSWKSSYAAIDPLYRTSAQARGGIDQVSGLSAGDGKTNVGADNSVTRGRASNLIRYDTPSFGGLKGVAWISLEESFVRDTTDVFDGSGYGIGVHYDTGPFFASFDWLRDEAIDSNGGDKDAFAIGGKYTADPFALWARFEYDGGAISVVKGLGGTTQGIGETQDAHYAYAGVSYNITPNNVLFGTYAHRFESNTGNVPGVGDVDNNDDLDAFLVAIAHGLSKRTWLYFGYGYNSAGDGGIVNPDNAVPYTTRPAGDDFHVVTGGIKHSF